jgi:hypothetical protein
MRDILALTDAARSRGGPFQHSMSLFLWQACLRSSCNEKSNRRNKALIYQRIMAGFIPAIHVLTAC